MLSALSRVIREELYARPRRAVPTLGLFLGGCAFWVTGEVFTALKVSFLCWGLWSYFSRFLLIDDQRLGPVQTHCRGTRNGDSVWISFDDGPGPQTEDIVRTLNQWNCPATFFFVADKLRSYPDVDTLRELLRAGGHRVANHSDTHPNLLTLRRDQIAREISEADDFLSHAFPQLYRPLFRPPFGYRNQAVFQEANSRGLRLVGWSLNSLDFLGGGAPRIARRVLNSLCSGSIVLFHDGPEGREETLKALPPILKDIRRRGWQVVAP